MNLSDTGGVMAEGAVIVVAVAEMFKGNIDMYTTDTEGAVDEDAVVGTIADGEKETNLSS